MPRVGLQVEWKWCCIFKEFRTQQKARFNCLIFVFCWLNLHPCDMCITVNNCIKKRKIQFIVASVKINTLFFFSFPFNLLFLNRFVSCVFTLGFMPSVYRRGPRVTSSERTIPSFPKMTNIKSAIWISGSRKGRRWTGPALLAGHLLTGPWLILKLLL